MKMDPDDIREFIAVLRSKTPDEWGMPERTYYQWLSGDVPGAFVILFHNPEAALAVFRESERRALLRELAEKKAG